MKLDTVQKLAEQRARAAGMVMPAADQWVSGLPLGNGDMGVMVWGGGHPLNFTLDKSDLWDTRLTWPDNAEFNYTKMRELARDGDWEQFQHLFETEPTSLNPVTPTKLYFGRLELDFGSEVTERVGELSFYRGVATVIVRCGEREHVVQAFVHRERNLLCLRVSPWPPALVPRLRGLAETNPALAELDSFSPVHKPSGEDGVSLTQVVPEGLAFAAVADLLDDGTICVALASASEREAALAEARGLVDAAQRSNWEALLAEHEQAWAGFWSASGLVVPDEKIEYLWHQGLYLFASATRPGCLPPGLQGVWEVDGQLAPWRGDYHADMNVQETFWPAYANNHLELGRCLTDFLSASLPAAQDFCRRFFGWEGAFFPTAFVPGMVFIPGWATVQFWMGVPGWLAHHMWLQWQYERDDTLLVQQVLPFLTAVFRFYDGLLEEGPDGRLHVPFSTSPEMHDNRPEAWHADPTCDLAIIRNLCRWVSECEAAAGESEVTARAAEIAARLAEYPVNAAGGLQLWPGQDYHESHRHPSHLMSLHPFDDLHIEGDEQMRQIVHRSMWELIERGMGRWAGHTYPQSLALAARARYGNMAANQAHLLLDHFCGDNGLHLNGDFRNVGLSMFRTKVFCLEANCGVAGTIPELLLQSWGGRLRVFPAIPDDWGDVAFHSLRGEGGWLVSALREAGRTKWVTITATVAGQGELENPFADDGRETYLSFALEAGETAVFEAVT